MIAAENSDGKTTLWIRKKDFLLKKSQSILGANWGKGSSPVPAGDIDEAAKKVLNDLGLKSTPEEVAKAKKQAIAIKEQIARTIQFTNTETFENIAVDEWMTEEDFEVKVPATAQPGK